MREYIPKHWTSPWDIADWSDEALREQFDNYLYIPKDLRWPLKEIKNEIRKRKLKRLYD